MAVFTLADVKSVTILQLPAKKGQVILDVRTEEEYAKEHVEGVVNIPFVFRTEGQPDRRNDKFLESVKQAASLDTPILLLCATGRRSKSAAIELMAAGFDDVIDVDGGMKAWKEEGKPLALT